MAVQCQGTTLPGSAPEFEKIANNNIFIVLSDNRHEALYTVYTVYYRDWKETLGQIYITYHWIYLEAG